MKKTLLFCAVLALLLSAPALASENSTRIDAQCSLPEISVTIPATAEVFINPYRMPVEIDAASSTEQIISTPACIENKSKVPLSVTVTVTAEIREDSDMRLSTSSTKTQTTTSKSAFVYFEMQAASSPNQVSWDSEYDAEKHLLVRSGTSRPKAGMAILDQADQPNHFGAFRLTGDCIPTPRFPWTEADGIDVEIAFTFKPLPRVGD